jgi:hypothetical protein
MGKAYSAPVGLRPVTDPTPLVTRGAREAFTQRLVEQIAPEKDSCSAFPRIYTYGGRNAKPLSDLLPR